MKLNTAIMTTSLVLAGIGMANAQEKAKPEDTEFYTPVPKVVTPGNTTADAPSDAVVLFNGKDLSQWVMTSDKSPAKWKVADGIFTVDKKAGNIETKQAFNNYQLHLEWRVPANITGESQARGNSGLFLAAIGNNKEDGYELQILDNYNNKTYTNGMVGSIYKQTTPLFNAAKKPGEWQTYDVIWTAPTFNTDGSLKTPAKVTALLNGIIVQNNFELKGPTQYIGHPAYRKAHGASPIMLQAHGDKSEPISYRNIWVREL